MPNNPTGGKMFHTKDTVLRPDWKLVGFMTVLILDILILLYLGINLGKNLEVEECNPCFATLEDMKFLVEELRECKETRGEAW